MFSRPGRQCLKLTVAPCFGIQCKKKMRKSVGNPNIRHPGRHIVTERLFGHRLIQGNFRRLAFHQQTKNPVITRSSDIGAPGQSVHPKGLFHTNQTGCYPVMCTQPVDNMLPYPFFGRKAHIFFSDCVENIVFLPVSLESVIERRKVKRREQPQV